MCSKEPTTRRVKEAIQNKWKVKNFGRSLLAIKMIINVRKDKQNNRFRIWKVTVSSCWNRWFWMWSILIGQSLGLRGPWKKPKLSEGSGVDQKKGTRLQRLNPEKVPGWYKDPQLRSFAIMNIKMPNLMNSLSRETSQVHTHFIIPGEVVM